MSEFKIKREEPPVLTRKVANSTKIDREVRYMKKNAGEWFKVREGASAGAYTVYKKRGCLTRQKSVGEGRYDIWAMYPADAEGATDGE